MSRGPTFARLPLHGGGVARRRTGRCRQLLLCLLGGNVGGLMLVLYLLADDLHAADHDTHGPQRPKELGERIGGESDQLEQPLGPPMAAGPDPAYPASGARARVMFWRSAARVRSACAGVGVAAQGSETEVTCCCC